MKVKNVWRHFLTISEHKFDIEIAQSISAV